MARIMLVEDEPITAMDLEQMLVAIGHEVTGWVDEGEDAVEKARELEPDLVLMDIRLKGEMTGVQAAERIREAARDRGETTPVIFLTAFADKETVDSACRTSPYGYLVKPFTERSVAAVVQVALARAEEEREVRERESFLRSALRSLGEALVAVDARGRVRFANALALGVLGGEEAIVGRAADEVARFFELESERPVDPIGPALREGQVFSGRARLAPLEGRAREVEISAAPMLGHDGSITGGVLAFREIPGEHEVGSVDLGPSERFSDRIQHEINSPLTYNLGALSIAIREIDTLRAMRAIDVALLEEQAKSDEDGRLAKIESLIRAAHEGATRIAVVMDEMRNAAFLDLEQVPMKPVEILELAVGACADELERVVLTREIGPSPVVRGNKWQLARALADELRRSIGGGVEATLRLVSGTASDGRAELKLVLSPRHGAALPPASAGEIGRRVLEAHHGELVVRDVEGARVISLRIPPIAASPRDVPTDEVRGDVLVIDDEPMVGRVLEMMLSPHHDVTVVHSAASALELIEQGNEFDVILSDVSMPEMNGRELHERLSHTHPEMAGRMIFVSGGGVDADTTAFLASMIERRLDKPFRADRLVPLLAELVLRARSGPG